MATESDSATGPSATGPATGLSSISGPKKRSRSEVWEHFTRSYNAVKRHEEGTCKYCVVVVFKYTGQNGTSSMWNHLKVCVKYPLNTDKSQQLLSATFKPLKPGEKFVPKSMGTWKFDQELCRDMLARMIIVDVQPFSMVEREGFKDFVSTLQPLFKLVSRFTVARDCMKMYISEKTILKSYLNSVKSSIALTTDLWTFVQNQSYLCLTAHFIDDDFKLHKRILNFVVMASHKGKDIGKMVEQCILGWELKDNISTITVDNASSNDVVVGYLTNKLKNQLILGGEFFHVRCAAHILNLIVRDGLKEIDDSIVRVRCAVKYVRGSPLRVKTFDECIKSEGITFKGSVCLDVSTRWNSTYLMLEAALKFKQAFLRLEDDDEVGFVRELEGNIPTLDDWENVRILTLFLKNFYAATKRISGSLYVTFDNYFGEIVSILTTLKCWEQGANDNLKSMAKRMKEKFDKYYGKIEKTNVMVLLAAILDPRHKLKYVEYCCGMICNDPLIVASMVTQIKITLDRLYAFYEKRLSSLEVQDHDDIVDDGSESCNDTGDDGVPLVDVMDPSKIRELFSKQNNMDVDMTSHSDLQRYLEEPCEKDTKGFDLMSWWKEKQTVYKVLALMARDILAIPISTVASESAFSTSGRVLDQFRSSLNADLVEALICAQDWLRRSQSPITIEQYMEDAEKYEQDLNGLTQEMTNVGAK